MTDRTDEFDPPHAAEAQQQPVPVEPPESEPTPDETVIEDRSSSPAEDEAPNPNKREARYRIQLRETEAERDHLRATVEALQRAEVERLAGAKIQKPTALWSANIDLADLLDDAGTVDPVKVAAAAEDARKTLGLAQTRPPGYVRGEGRVVSQPAVGNQWENAFTR